MIVDLADVLTNPARVAEVPTEQVPRLLVTIAAEQSRLAAAQGALVARLAVPAPSGRDVDDVVTDVDEVGNIVRRSGSWVRKNGHTLPGFQQPGGKGTRVGWSRRALEEWVSTPTS